MPELPEVDAGRRIAQRAAGGRQIVGVWCADDPIVFERVAAATFRKALLGRRVRAVRRHGKHLWFELDGRPWLCVHFGMTGGFQVPGRSGVTLMSSGRRGEDGGWPPRFAKLALTFDGGGALAIADARRLGRIRLRHDPRREPPISELGFDALLEMPPPRRFADLVRGRGAPVKALLLDQSFAAGVGNWIADEVLYQARIDPRRRARTLTDQEIGRVRAKLASVVRIAVAARSDSDRYPRTWLFHHRWGRNAAAMTARGERIRHDTIGGRTTAWVPAVQR